MWQLIDICLDVDSSYQLTVINITTNQSQTVTEDHKILYPDGTIASVFYLNAIEQRVTIYSPY
jgi:hypothetical protein